MKTLKKISLLVFLSIFLTAGNAYGQVSKDEKKIDKCWSVYEKKGMSKGIEKLRKHMASQTFPSFYAHESLVRMEYRQYLNGTGNGLTISTNGEMSDTLADLMKLLSQSFSKINFVNTCRRSTLESTSPSGDRYIQELMIHVDPDTAVSEKSQLYFDEAEEFYEKQDFELAAMNYRKAFTEDPSFYKATLYYGAAKRELEQEDSALYFYEEAVKMQPFMLEPRIFIITHLTNKGLYYRAKKECIEALTIYPGYNMKYKLSRILDVENKVYDEHRITRTFYANEIGNDNQLTMDHNPVWKDYRAAKDLVRLYCDEDGIIEPNGEFEDRYLEVFSYRNMLEKHQNDLPEILHFADKMKEEGYLEPYVFISQFHYDIYPQFKDYMSDEANRAKAVEYVEKYLVVTKATR